MNKCKTRMGARLLRANLFQPLNDLRTLEARLEAVESLATEESLLSQIGEKTGELCDFDRIIATL
ncbi:MutS protein msh4, partial [Bonamia ostreae]